jgi:hypothetical protein
MGGPATIRPPPPGSQQDAPALSHPARWALRGSYSPRPRATATRDPSAARPSQPRRRPGWGALARPRFNPDTRDGTRNHELAQRSRVRAIASRERSIAAFAEAVTPPRS